VNSAGAFDKVAEKIGQMITKMGTDEAQDLHQIQTCQRDRTEQGRAAVSSARQADYFSGEIAELQRAEAELSKVIVDMQADVKKAETEIEEAQAQRAKENTAYLTAKQDDESAKAVVGSALNTLESFYGIRGRGSFLQTDASEAQEPTSENAREKHTSEASGILNMLKMIMKDIDDDISKAKKEERAAVKENSDFVGVQSGLIRTLNTRISTAEGKLGEKQETRAEMEADRGMQLSMSNTATNIMNANEKGCNYFTVNFDLRVKNRAVELDGLIQARAALTGSKFVDMLELKAKPVALRGSK